MFPLSHPTTITTTDRLTCRRERFDDALKKILVRNSHYGPPSPPLSPPAALAPHSPPSYSPLSPVVEVSSTSSSSSAASSTLTHSKPVDMPSKLSRLSVHAPDDFTHDDVILLVEVDRAVVATTPVNGTEPLCTLTITDGTMIKSVARVEDDLCAGGSKRKAEEKNEPSVKRACIRSTLAGDSAPNRHSPLLTATSASNPRIPSLMATSSSSLAPSSGDSFATTCNVLKTDSPISSASLEHKQFTQAEKGFGLKPPWLKSITA
jgi:hypothetical protein